MPIDSFEVSATDPGKGDTWATKTDPDATHSSVNSGFLSWGFDFDVKGSDDVISYLRFEVDVPHDATIQGVRLNMAATAASTGAIFTTQGGFLNPLHARAEWKDGNAWNITNYPTQDQLPLPEWNLGAGSDPDVWYGGAAGFNVGWTPIAIDLQPISIGDGTLTGTVTAAGTWIAQLEAMLADNAVDANRGVGTVNGAGFLAVAIALHKPQPHGIDQYQSTRSRNFATPSAQPTLEIEWTAPVSNFPPVVTIQVPSGSITRSKGILLPFQAISIDPEDGDISAGIEWSSDLDGALHTGASFKTNTLTVGTHVIEARSTDSGAEVGTDTVSVTIVSSGGEIDADAQLSDKIVAKAQADFKIEATANADSKIDAVTKADSKIETEFQVSDTIQASASVRAKTSGKAD